MKIDGSSCPICHGKKSFSLTPIGVGMIGVMIVGIIGLLFVNGTFEINEQNLNESIQNTPTKLPQIEKSETTQDTSILVADSSSEISKNLEEERKALKIKEAKQRSEIRKEEEERKVNYAEKNKELIEYALQIINEDRKKFDLQPVLFSENQAAQVHAEDILKTRIISHWMTNGEKPYMTYTRLGGTGAVSQNVGFSGYANAEECKNAYTRCEKIDPLDSLKKSEYSMMYDDASSDWGHRDNILQPYHTHVSLGIAYDDYTFVLVQNFEDNYIDFTNISENNGTVSFSGTLKEGSLDNIGIYYDHSPTTPRYQEHKEDSYYRLGGDPIFVNPHHINLEYKDNGSVRRTYGGEESIGINKPLSSDVFYEPSTHTFGIADKWVVNGNYVDVSFDMSPFVTKSGVYTIMLVIENKNETVPITTYSIIKNNQLVDEDFMSPKVHYACTEEQLAQYEEMKTEYDELSAQYDKIPQTVKSEQEYVKAQNMYYQLQALNERIMNFKCFHGATIDAIVPVKHTELVPDKRFFNGAEIVQLP